MRAKQERQRKQGQEEELICVVRVMSNKLLSVSYTPPLTSRGASTKSIRLFNTFRGPFCSSALLPPSHGAFVRPFVNSEAIETGLQEKTVRPTSPTDLSYSVKHHACDIVNLQRRNVTPCSLDEMERTRWPEMFAVGAGANYRRR